jgi:hypothetical protein
MLDACTAHCVVGMLCTVTSGTTYRIGICSAAHTKDFLFGTDPENSLATGKRGVGTFCKLGV